MLRILLDVDEEELTVRLVHHRVKQYIIRGMDGVKYMDFSARDAQKLLGNVVVTYLGYSDFETALLRFKVHSAGAQSEPDKLAQEPAGSPSNSKLLVENLSMSTLQGAPGKSKAVAEVRSSLIHRPEHAFKLVVI